jgi:hypothetical protein
VGQARAENTKFKPAAKMANSAKMTWAAMVMLSRKIAGNTLKLLNRFARAQIAYLKA